MDERCFDTEDCQLVGGSGENCERSGREVEETPRGDRERIHNERRQDVGRAKAVGGASRWTAVELDGDMTVISAHVPHKGMKLGDFEAVLTDIQDLIEDST